MVDKNSVIESGEKLETLGKYNGHSVESLPQNVEPALLTSMNNDTASDSDYDENDVTIEEDDDSIAPEDDVADSDELEGLMKESEMPLDDILASYGVSSDPHQSTLPALSSNGDSTSSYPGLRSSRRLRLSTTLPPSSATNRNSSPPDTASSSQIDSTHKQPSLKRPHSSLADNEGIIAIDIPTKNPTTASPSASPSIPSNDQSPATHHRRRSLSESASHHHVSPANAADDNGLNGNQADRISRDGQETVAHFWKRALSGGEDLTHSYDSEDDEDYEPSEDSSPDWREEIRVGEAYQVEVPDWPYDTSSATNLLSWDTQRFEGRYDVLWQPTSKIAERELVRFIHTFSSQKEGAIVEQDCDLSFAVDDEEALLTLMQADYDIDEALYRAQLRSVDVSALPNHLESWTEVEATAFERGFATEGKDFRQIRDIRLKHKSIADLVHFYYLWKKTARHDDFVRNFRRDKKKSPHSSVTNFMDCLVLEQEEAGRAYISLTSGGANGSGDQSSTSSLVNAQSTAVQGDKSNVSSSIVSLTRSDL